MNLHFYFYQYESNEFDFDVCFIFGEESFIRRVKRPELLTKRMSLTFLLLLKTIIVPLDHKGENVFVLKKMPEFGI